MTSTSSAVNTSFPVLFALPAAAETRRKYDVNGGCVLCNKVDDDIEETKIKY